MAWATTATGGGIWGHSGVASDGTNMFVITGNTIGTGGMWSGGEAIIRLQAGPFWSGMPTDYWAPTNWFNRSTTATRIWAVSARCSSTCLEQILPSLYLRQERIATRICLIGTTLVASRRLSPSSVLVSLSANHRLLTARARALILFSARAISEGIQDHGDKSADHSLRLEREPEWTRLALGHNDRWDQQRDRMGCRCSRRPAVTRLQW